jgi:hypothetical protein
MSIADFSKTVQSQIYKSWLDKLEKNIITNSTKSLRGSQQVSGKTDFYLTKDTVMSMYKTITGKQMDGHEADVLLYTIAQGGSAGGAGKLEGTFTTINNSKAVVFKSIGFDTISSRLVDVFEHDYLVQEAYRKAEEKYINGEIAELNKRTDLKGKAKQIEIDKIEAEGKRRASFGYYFNKGHVIGIATNLTKEFRNNLDKADALSRKERDSLIQVLDQYIAKLQADDLNTANLPNAVDQELYAGYIKSSSKYLVEIQCAVKNQGSGRDQASPILDELRKLFSVNSKDITDILTKSPTLGIALVNTKGSSSFKDLVAKDMLNILTGSKLDTRQYKQAPKLIGKKTTKINKPASNKAKIQTLKNLKSKLQSTKSDSNKIREMPQITETVPNLLALINTQLQDVISANMGDGSSRNVLNYRTGRFASTVNVEYLSTSREGMISAFYSYMKNPYATFSAGGRQSKPSSRDPKLLISKSIRQIAEQVASNNLRAVAL